MEYTNNQTKVIASKVKDKNQTYKKTYCQLIYKHSHKPFCLIFKQITYKKTLHRKTTWGTLTTRRDKSLYMEKVIVIYENA